MSPQKYEVVTGIVVAIMVLLLAGFFILVLVAFINRRKKKYIQEKEIMKTSFEQALLQTQLEIQEQTLKTISQEIHDNIGQVLSLAKLNLNTMDITQPDDLQEKIAGSKQLVSKAIQDLRDLSRSMNTDNIKSIGLIPAINYELDLLRKASGQTIQFELSGTVTRLDPQKELILFRIVQEVLNNIIKHAGANIVTVLAKFSETDFELNISDNGQGFDPDGLHINANQTSGQGIRNMKNRAGLIGASFSLRSVPAKGTSINLKVPLN